MHIYERSLFQLGLMIVEIDKNCKGACRYSLTHLKLQDLITRLPDHLP